MTSPLYILFPTLLMAGCASAPPTYTPCKPGDLMRFTSNGYVIDCTATPGMAVPKPKALSTGQERL